jgi:PAS domain S-box-containing protein
MTGTHSDITERKRIEARLRESEHNYRSFFETIDDMIFIGDLTGGIIWANAAAIGKLGYSSEELCSMDILDLHRPADRETAQQILEEMLRRERQYCPLPLLSKDGRPVPSESRVWMGTWNHEPAICGVCKDLSAQQAALDMFEKVFEANPTPMALSCFPDRSFKAVNRAFCDLTGYQKCEVIGKTSTDFNLFANESEQQQVTNQLEREGRIQGMALAVRTKAGELRDGLFFGEIVESQGERFFLTAMVDITTQKQVESELRETQERLEQRVLTRTAELQNVNDALLTENTARRHTEATLEEHRQRLRHLASQLTLAEEQERHELAVQLHDTIGQELAMARLRLEHLRSGVVPEYARHLEVASGLLEDAVGHVHVLTHELGATVLYELGLPAALRSLGSHVSEQYDLAFSYHQTGEYRRLRKDLEVQLFRAARELVYNVLKHAQASQIDVSLEIDLGELAVTVADDGCGFNSEASEPEASSHRSGFGLFSIRERLVTLGGRLELASKAGQGTSASVIVPISHDADEAANQEPMP